MRKNKKGFTLVELVIVIAVIAILAAVLLPTFSGIIQRARLSSATQRATSLRTDFLGEHFYAASDMIYIDNNNTPDDDTDDITYKTRIFVEENGTIYIFDLDAGGNLERVANNEDSVDYYEELPTVDDIDDGDYYQEYNRAIIVVPEEVIRNSQNFQNSNNTLKQK